IIYDSTQIEELNHFEIDWDDRYWYRSTYRPRSALVAHFKLRDSGAEFMFMVNHLYRGSGVDPRRLDQAKKLHDWAAEQTIPVIAVGDYNFDYDLDPGQDGFNYQKGLGDMTGCGSFEWIRPTTMVTTHDSTYNSILDFVFLADPTGSVSATSEIIVTFPKGFVALSNGVLLETTENADSKTAHWAQTIPHPSYLVSLIVGRYVEINDEGGGVPLHYFVRPKFERQANLSFSKTGGMMKFFQDWIDLPYPYESYSQVAVVDFIFGGMENSSITTLTERTLHDEAAHLTYSSDGLVAHELAHQWWGDLLTCRDWTHLWLNEAFATYFQALYFEHDRGREDFDYEMLRYRRAYFERESIDAARPIVNSTLGRPGNALNRRIYDKGAWVLHMLRRRMGDSLFQKGIREYARTFQGKPVETNNLLRTLEAVSGEGLEAFFDQWVHHAGYPELEVDYTWSDETGVAEIRVRQTQTLSEIVPLFRMEVDVLFVTQAGRHVERIKISEASHTFQIKLDSRPQYVRFDPDGNLLKRLAFHNSEDMTLAQLEDDTTFLGQIEAIDIP
ncbi:MAG: hypothetical protein IIB38_16105, partial [Candidatus Hydrogenedentes bacterium]|nr:hypothetical protein [Candidatus Hydrogenedentota bacterium]